MRIEHDILVGTFHPLFCLPGSVLGSRCKIALLKE
jgi:hypothetical protein